MKLKLSSLFSAIYLHGISKVVGMAEAKIEFMCIFAFGCDIQKNDIYLCHSMHTSLFRLLSMLMFF